MRPTRRCRGASSAMPFRTTTRTRDQFRRCNSIPEALARRALRREPRTDQHRAYLRGRASLRTRRGPLQRSRGRPCRPSRSGIRVGGRVRARPRPGGIERQASRGQERRLSARRSSRNHQHFAPRHVPPKARAPALRYWTTPAPNPTQSGPASCSGRNSAETYPVPTHVADRQGGAPRRWFARAVPRSRTGAGRHAHRGSRARPSRHPPGGVGRGRVRCPAARDLAASRCGAVPAAGSLCRQASPAGRPRLSRDRRSIPGTRSRELAGDGLLSTRAAAATWTSTTRPACFAGGWTRP